MAGNLDATYPTKTEFKDVPVDPSAASKTSVETHFARDDCPRGGHDFADDHSTISNTPRFSFA